MDTLQQASARLRAAVASQAYDEARTLIPGYCQTLQQEFDKHPLSSPEARQIAEDARELYQWMARTILVDRAHCAAALQRLAGMSSFLKSTSPGDRHTCQVEG